MQLGQGLYLIPKVRGANTYALTEGALGEYHLTMIDTGMPGNAAKIMGFLKFLGNEQITSCTIVITHPDIDHSGSVADLKERLAFARVAIHEADAARLVGERPLREAHGFIGLIFKAMSPFMKFRPVTPNVLLKDGDRVDGLTVIHTPGHTRGSICLYSERLKAMFVGDALRTDRHGQPILPSAGLAVDFDEAKRSVRKIASYEFELLLPGHGPPVLADASKKVKALAV